MFRSPNGGNLRPFTEGKGTGGGHGHPGRHWPGKGNGGWSSHAERGSIRSPPYWEPAMEDTYPFRHWLADAIMWCLSTDVDEIRKGPQLELSLGGIARDLVREIPLQYKINGAMVDLNDGQGPQQLTGAAFILNGLSARFAPLEEEANMRSLADLYGFARLPGESVDMVLTWWEVVVQRARARTGIVISTIFKISD